MSAVALTPGPCYALQGTSAGRGGGIRGFSLIELLVVVLIIGLGMAVVGFAIGNNKPQELRNDARDFAHYTALVEEASVLSNEAWGVQIYSEDDGDGAERIAYRFLRLTAKNGWVPDHPEGVPAGGRFAADVVAELQVDGEDSPIGPLPKVTNTQTDAATQANATAQADTATDTVTTTDTVTATDTVAITNTDGKKSSGNTPAIWLAPGGDVTPFKLRLHFDGDHSGPAVSSDPLGRISLDLKKDNEND